MVQYRPTDLPSRSVTIQRKESTMTESALTIRSLKDKVSPEEWAVRVDLAACYRLVARYGWEDLVFTHISARVPGAGDQFLINPYGMFFDEITASSLVKVDLQGNKLDDSPFPVSPAGFVIHSAIPAARHDVECVLHTHTLNGVAVSTQRAGLLPISQHALFALPRLAYHDFEGPALNDDEKPRLVADLGDRTSLILRNHGLLTVGETIADAFVNMYYLEASCAIQVRAQSGGGDLIPVPKDVIDRGYAAAAKEQRRLVYRPHRSTKDPDLFIFYEQYKDDAAFDAHRKAPHLTSYRERREKEGLTEGAVEVEFYRSLTD